jgi:hypothetical protein
MGKPVESMTLASLIVELDQICDLDGSVYEVRKRVAEDKVLGKWPGFAEGKSSWEHPTVIRYGELVTEIKKRVKIDDDQELLKDAVSRLGRAVDDILPVLTVHLDPELTASQVGEVKKLAVRLRRRMEIVRSMVLGSGLTPTPPSDT